MQGSLSLMKKVNKFTFPDILTTSLERKDWVAPFFPQDDVSLSEIEQKFRLLKSMSWASTETDDFWIKVHTYKDVTGNHQFRVLSSRVLASKVNV